MVFSILENPIIVYDELLSVLTQHVPETLKFPFESPKLIAEIQAVLQSEQISHVVLKEPECAPFSLRLFPIVTAHDILGVLCVVESHHRLEEQDVVLAEQCNLVLALDFRKRESIFEAEQRVKGGFLEELITANNVGVLKHRARLLGLTDGDTYSFMVVDVGDVGNEDSRMYRHIHRKVEQLALNSNRFSLVITKLNTIVILNALPRGLDRDVVLRRSRKLGENLIEALRASYEMISCSIGIGRVCDDIGDLLQSYQDAKQCVAFIQRQKTTNVVRDYVELGAMRFILNQPKEQLLQFVKMTLKPLLSCAPSKRMELLKTLDAFFRAGRQHKEAAALLGIHPNTFAYRLKRLEMMIGYPIQISTNFDLHFAWKVVDTFNLKSELFEGDL
jgi:sugar diacid utilization regulator